MRVGTSTSAPAEQAAFGEILEAFKLVLLFKYAAWSGTILVELALDAYEDGIGAVPARLTSLLTISFLMSIPVMVAVVLWIGTDRAAYGYAVMATIGADALVKTVRMGPYFLNHYFLQIIMGVIGLFAVARFAAGDRQRDAWKPMAWLAILLWGVAGAKKLLHGSFASGDYVASTVGMVRESPIGWFSGFLLKRDGQALVPRRCCVSGDVDVSVLVAGIVVLIGIGMAVAELLPVGFVLWRGGRAVVGWVMLATTVVATALTNEPDFGLTNVALVTLWAHTRALRRACVVFSLAMAGALVWLRLI